LLDNIWQHFGATSPDHLRSWLDRALRDKLGPHGSDQPVVFCELKDISLKVVATDLHAGEVRVFGADDDAQVAVADALVASATYPIFFRPALIGTSLFVVT
jgi:predicted acylesterase/phospholipase RssA